MIKRTYYTVYNGETFNTEAAAYNYLQLKLETEVERLISMSNTYQLSNTLGETTKLVINQQNMIQDITRIINDMKLQPNDN